MRKGQTKRVWTPEQKSEIVHKHLDDHVSVRTLKREYTADRNMICRRVKEYIAEGETAFIPKGHPGNKFAALHVSKNLSKLERLRLMDAKLEKELVQTRKFPKILCSFLPDMIYCRQAYKRQGGQKMSYDVVVVGACTAGTYFAGLLGKAGLKVLVIDKDPEENRGQLEGVRVIAFTLIPMFAGTLIGNAIIKNTPQADVKYDIYGHVIDVPQGEPVPDRGLYGSADFDPAVFCRKGISQAAWKVSGGTGYAA